MYECRNDTSYETKANFSSCQETFPELWYRPLEKKKFLIFHLLEYLQNGERYQEESRVKNF